MSAYVVSSDTIDFLVTLAIYIDRPSNAPSFRDAAGVRYQVNADSASMAGLLLLAENVRSVNHRYGENEPVGEYVFRCVDSVMHRCFASNPQGKIELIVAGLKSCDCLEYQSCETDDYRNQEAFRLLDSIRGMLIHNLPGYSDAPWGWQRKPENSPTANGNFQG